MFENLFDQSNWLATLAAAGAYFVVGAIWYGLLGKQWMAAAGLSEERVKSGSKIIYLYSFFLLFVICMVMSKFIIPEASLTVALKVGIGVGLVFSGFTTINHYLYTMQKTSLMIIDVGYTTIGSIAAALVLWLMN